MSRMMVPVRNTRTGQTDNAFEADLPFLRTEGWQPVGAAFPEPITGPLPVDNVTGKTVPQVGTQAHVDFMNARNTLINQQRGANLSMLRPIASPGLTQQLQTPVSPLTVQSSGSRPAAATTLSLPSTGQSGSSTGVLNALQGQPSPPPPPPPPPPSNQVTFGGNPLTPTGGPLPNPANTTPAPAPAPTITPLPPVPNTPTATGATTVSAPPSNQFNGGQDLEDQGAALLNRGNILQGLANALRDISLRQSDNLSNLFDQQFQRQQGLVNNLLTSGGENSLLGAMQSQLGLLNSERGLSPQAKAALRQQATADIPERFNRAAEAMRVELGRRGAIGGRLPGSTQDIVRGFAPLFAAREREMGQAVRDAFLEDERQKLQSLLANRQIASNALGTGSNLLGQVANATSPNPLLQAALQSRGQSLDAASLGNQAFGTQASLLGALSNTDPNSFRNSLLSALAGGGINAGFDIADRFLFGDDGSRSGGLFNNAANAGLRRLEGALDSDNVDEASLEQALVETGVDSAAAASAVAALKSAGVIGGGSTAAAGMLTAAEVEAVLGPGAVGPLMPGGAGGFTSFLTSTSFLVPAAIAAVGFVLAKKFIGRGRKAANQWVNEVENPLYLGSGDSPATANGPLARINSPANFPGERIPQTGEDMVNQLKKLMGVAAFWNAGVERLSDVARMDDVTRQAVNGDFGATFNATWDSYLRQAQEKGADISGLRRPQLRIANA